MSPDERTSGEKAADEAGHARRISKAEVDSLFPPPHDPSLTPVTEGSWKNNTPTRRMYRWPPAKDNPGRVSEGTAEDMQKKAELSRLAEHKDVIVALRSQRSTKAQRLARRDPA